MPTRRMLPKYVSQFTDNRGTERFRFRRTGQKTHYFSASLGSAEFMAEYQACLEEGRSERPVRQIEPGSIDELAVQFYRSTAFNKGKPVTRQKNRAIIDAFRDGIWTNKRGEELRIGGLSVRRVEFVHLDTIIAAKAATHRFAAVNLRKQLKRLFKHAVRLKLRPDNPADMTEPLSQKTDGFHTWSEAEITQYQAHHALGTKARLALELYLWTAKRRSDGVQLGPQHIQDGYFYGTDEKTGKPGWIPVAPQLQAAIDAMPAIGHLCFLVTQQGKPFSNKGFGNRMRKWCDEAGLPQCSTHGLRKAMTRRLAEAGIGNQGIKSITLHGDDREVATYTREANQKAMARDVMGTLCARHLAST